MGRQSRARQVRAGAIRTAGNGSSSKARQDKARQGRVALVKAERCSGGNKTRRSREVSCSG